MQRIKWQLRGLIPRALLHNYRTRRYGLAYVRRVCGGMLGTRTYERIYREALTLPDLDFLEIGAAGGAATVALGWAYRDSRKKSGLVVVEKGEGGSRAKFGDKSTNLARLLHNLRQFGVADRVRLFSELLTPENGDQLAELIQTEKLAGMMLDADGRIHRDFGLFWDRLIVGGLIVVDDYHDSLSRKHERTYRLLNQLIDWGYFEPIELVGNTYLGRKPAGTPRPLDLAGCNEIVELVGV